MEIYEIWDFPLNILILLISADINESSSNPCDTNGFCENTDGSFTCTCNGGYTGDGFTCTGNHLLRPQFFLLIGSQEF